jgi:hypothetical protein
MKRHDSLYAQIYFNVRKEVLAKLDDEHWYKLVPKPVERSPEYKVTLSWNQQEKTDRTCHNNKPEIMFHGKEIWTYLFIGNHISGTRNVIKKEEERFNKIYRPYNRITGHRDNKSRRDTSNNRGNWKHPRIIQNILRQALMESTKCLSWEIKFNAPQNVITG